MYLTGRVGERNTDINSVVPNVAPSLSDWIVNLIRKGLLSTCVICDEKVNNPSNSHC